MQYNQHKMLSQIGGVNKNPAKSPGGFWLSRDPIHSARMAKAKWLWGGVMDFRGGGY